MFKFLERRRDSKRLNANTTYTHDHITYYSVRYDTNLIMFIFMFIDDDDKDGGLTT